MSESDWAGTRSERRNVGKRVGQSMHLAEARLLTYVDSDSGGILRGLDGYHVRIGTREPPGAQCNAMYSY